MKPYVEKFQSLEWGLTQSIQIQGPFVLIHGGLGDQLERRSKILSSIQSIAQNIHRKLRAKKSTSAQDLATEAVGLLEADPIFNAGFGARLQQDGVARLSSALMDGSTQRMAAVANVLAQKHPSKIVRKLLDSDGDRNLASIEGTAFALKSGFHPQSVETPDRVNEFLRKREGKSGTVGAVAIDQRGGTAACTSTGGRGYETPGRISDSFTPAGNFATPYGAVSCTGIGEQILDGAVAAAILTRVEDGLSLTESVSRTFQRHQKSRFGCIALDRRGHAIVMATRGALVHALITPQFISFGLLPSDWMNTVKGFSEKAMNDRKPATKSKLKEQRIA